MECKFCHSAMHKLFNIAESASLSASLCFYEEILTILISVGWHSTAHFSLYFVLLNILNLECSGMFGLVLPKDYIFLLLLIISDYDFLKKNLNIYERSSRCLLICLIFLIFYFYIVLLNPVIS